MAGSSKAHLVNDSRVDALDCGVRDDAAHRQLPDAEADLLPLELGQPLEVGDARLLDGRLQLLPAQSHEKRGGRGADAAPSHDLGHHILMADAVRCSEKLGTSR